LLGIKVENRHQGKQAKNLMKTIVQKMIAAGAGLFLTTNVAVYGTTIYSDSTTDTGSSLNFVTGTTIGDEVVMAGAASSYALTSFSFEY
jgi:hypothetical protein